MNIYLRTASSSTTQLPVSLSRHLFFKLSVNLILEINFKIFFKVDTNMQSKDKDFEDEEEM